MVKKEGGRSSFSSVSLPAALVNEIEKLVKRTGYWPTKTDFIRQACMEKLEKHARIVHSTS